MARNLPVRLIICVDGTWFDPDGGNDKQGNVTNIYRFYASVGKGEFQDASGNRFFQEKMYVAGIGSEDSISKLEKLYTGVFGLKCLDQIENVYKACCRLTGPNDEVWLYGFSRGAYVVRAAAGLLHHLGALVSADAAHGSDKAFHKDYKDALKVYEKLRKGSRPKEEGNVHLYFHAKTRPAPTIKFIGAFDTVKAVEDKSLHDISLNGSIHHMRAALALNEDRKAMRAEGLWPSWSNDSSSLSNQTFVQAWFVGMHRDIGGSTEMDGLALYPLQWMMLESRAKGLIFKFEGDYGGRALLHNPLEIVGIDGGENKAWSCITENKLAVEIRDICRIHEEGSLFGKRYAVKLHQTNGVLAKFKEAREPFNDAPSGGGLKGYDRFSPRGTIIHPSVYMIIDKYLNASSAKKLFPFYDQIEIWREKMITSETLRMLFLRAQAATVDHKIDYAISETMEMYQKIIASVTIITGMPVGLISTRIAAAHQACTTVLRCFGLSAIDTTAMLDICKINVWDKLRSSLATEGFLATVIPMRANFTAIIQATARLFLKLACDLILIFTKAFKRATLRYIEQPEKDDVEVAARAYRQHYREVHKAVKSVVPDLSRSLQTGKVKLGITELLNKYKRIVTQDMGPPLARSEYGEGNTMHTSIRPRWPHS
ncbi:hypothetical protein F4823DRAFT_634728 [Ustulina deusta]|nr:hypothetical protein F4823DRAFT_634728 [Ustulina deusta]